ncbi:hypothetical protein L484_022102 [Morus notabilis]|uniref:Uncharacterized protein n=1 Tax=Morus notabilis TaxID=981085 RepID=W9QDM0_9ROSA|nr:hypothetical protein L484_022102 [Morus notabilis]
MVCWLSIKNKSNLQDKIAINHSMATLLLFLVSTSAVEVRRWSFEKREWVRKNERETQEEEEEEEERELDEYDGVFGVWFLVYGF